MLITDQLTDTFVLAEYISFQTETSWAIPFIDTVGVWDRSARVEAAMIDRFAFDSVAMISRNTEAFVTDIVIDAFCVWTAFNSS